MQKSIKDARPEVSGLELRRERKSKRAVAVDSAIEGPECIVNVNVLWLQQMYCGCDKCIVAAPHTF